MERKPDAAPGSIIRASSSAGRWREAAGSSPSAIEEIASSLREAVACLLRIPAGAITADRPLLAFGLDSLAAIELCGLVEERFGATLALDDLLAGATLDDVAAAAAAGGTGAPHRSREEEHASGVESAAATAEVPLSAGQRALWLVERLAPGSAAYNLAGAARVRGDLDATALRRAFQALVRRHPALRTSFVARRGEPLGQLHARGEIDFAVEPAIVSIEPAIEAGIESVTAPAQAEAAGPAEAAALPAALAEALRAAAFRPFDLERGPLLRVRVWPLAAGEAMLLLAVHHLVVDFWSLAILLRELGLLYRQETGGAPAPLAPLPITPGEAVLRQHRRLAGRRGEELWAHWRRTLAGDLPALDLPALELATDRPRPPLQTYAGGSRALLLDADLAGRVRTLAGAAGATLHAALLAAFQALLCRYSGQPRVLVGVPTAGRGARDLAGVVGYFVNPVVVGAEMTARTTATVLLAAVRDAARAALAHADFPFPLLVERLQAGRDASRPPLFQAMFALQRAARREEAGFAALALGEAGTRLDLGGLLLDSVALPERRVPCELTLMMAAVGDGLAASLQYNADLYDGLTAERMLGHFARLAGAMAASPETPLADLDLLSAAERRQLTAWSRAPERGPQDAAEACLHLLIAAQAARAPGAVGLVCGARSITYGELWLRSGRLAARLRHRGVRPEVRVGLFAGRTPEMVIGMLGVLRAGGAYVPLDPAYPADRLAFLVQDARPAVVLAEPAFASRLPVAGTPVELLTEEGDDSTLDRDDAAPARDVEPERDAASPGDPLTGNLAYLIYTSGSAGRPKAVALEHRGAVALALWARQEFAPEELAGVLATTSISFDLSVFELLVPLCWGGRVIVAESALELSQLGPELDVRLVNTVPSALAEALRRRPLPASVRTVNLAGEPLPRALVSDLYRAGVRRVLNLYGPSEDTTYSTAALQQPDEQGAPPIGSPIAGGRAYLLAAGGIGPGAAPSWRLAAQVPLGVRGEIYLGGPGLARGYFGRPELTAERFVPSPFAGGGDEAGARLYRTGDLARRLPGGGLEFLGRIDHQVKIRGFRVELGEVEAALRELPQVREAAVLALPAAADAGAAAGALRPSPAAAAPGALRLAAFIVWRNPGAGTAAETLRTALRRRLPEAMVPQVFTIVPALPLTPHGKLDRRALAAMAPGPGAARTESSPWRPPATPEEILLAACFAEALGVSRVGADDDFFALGGHSLLASRVQAEVGERLGIELPLAAFFQAPTVAALALRLAAAGSPRRQAAPAPERLPRDGRDFPLSFAQERLWFLDRLEPGSAAYHLAAAVDLTGPLDGAALRLALAETVRRHETLRTTFPEHAGQPVQRIGQQPPVQPVVSLTALPPAARQLSAESIARREARRPFALAEDAPLRLLLLRLAAERHRLLLTLHHIAADEASLELLIDELAALYAAFAARRPSPLAEPALQVADFAAWQRRTVTEEMLAPRLEWWQERLRDLPELELGAAGRRRGGDRHRAARRVERRVPDSTWSDLAALGRRTGGTLFSTLLAAFQACLARLTGENDVPVGCPVSTRNRRELAGAVGLFVDTMVLRGDLGGAPTFRDLLGRTRSALAAAHEREVPFELLVARLRPDRRLGRNPLFDVAFTLHRPPRARRLSDLAIEPLAIATGAAKFDLALFAIETETGLGLAVEAAADLFDAPATVRLLGHLESLLAAAAADPDRPAAELPLLGAAERHQLVHEWSAGLAGSPSPPAVHRQVAAWAARFPASLALDSAAGSLTYGDLSCRAGWLAQALRQLGVGPEEIVAIALPRSAESVAAALAVLVAGGAYLPLDPAHPAERLAAALADSRARVLLTSASLARELPAEAARACAVVVLDSWAAWDALGLPAAAGSMPIAPAPAAGAEPPPGSLAYVIYTSGSSAAPKGVALTHAGLSNLVSWHLRAYRVGPEDRAALIAGPGFDAAVWEVWPYLAAGASLHLPDPAVRSSPAELLGWLAARRITLAFLPTPLAEALVALPRPAGLALRALLTGGDRLHLRPAPGSGWTLVNHYGPTECTVVATWAAVPAAPDVHGIHPLPSIGSPIDGITAMVVGDGGEPQPQGAPGELCLGGAGLARGYLWRPDLTAERFVPDPLAAARGEIGARTYRTGDRARWRAGGDLEFLGRLDRQVKIRGFRLEPGEVEAALASHPEVREAAVAAHGAPGSVRLTAYVVPRRQERAAPGGLGPSGLDPGGSDLGSLDPDALEPAALRAWLRRRLPEAMVPAAFVTLPALPLTANGKLDRRALADPGARPPAARPASGARLPRTPTERLAAAAWAAALGLDTAAVALDDDFFAAGGHSLLAPRLAALLRQASGIELPLRIVFEQPTVAGLAAAVDQARALAGRDGWPGALPLPPIERVARQPPPPLSLAQQRLWLLDQLEPGSPVYNLPVPVLLEGALDAGDLRRAFERVVARHEALRTSFPVESGRPVQRIEAPPPVPLPCVSLTSLPSGRREPEAIRLACEQALRPFDLRRAPLLRTTLLRLRPELHALLLEVHHIAADGRSLDILLRDLAASYGAVSGSGGDVSGRTGGTGRTGNAAAPPALPELAVQYADYAVWQRRRLDEDAAPLAAALDWWRLRLAGAPPVLPLPFDRPRPAVPSFRGGSCRMELNAAEDAALRELGRSQGASLFMVLLAVFAALLPRLTGQGDLVVGTPIASRPRPELEPLIGMFVNNLVLRLDAAGDPPFLDLLAAVREACLAAYLREVPFEKLVEALHPDRDLGRNPFYQVVFALEGAGRPALALPGLRLRPLHAGSGTAKFELAVYMEERPAGLAALLEYSRDLFEAPTAIRLLAHFAALARQVSQDPRRRLFELPLLDEAARHQALREANDTQVARPTVPFVHRWIAARAAATPGAPAVTGGGRTLSYGELDRDANRLAHRLRALGVGPESRVAVALDRSPELIVAMLAIWKAGAAYVPLDTAYPSDRLAAMLADSGAAALLCEPQAAARLPAPALARLLPVDAAWWQGLADEPDHDPEVELVAENLAYVIYTSGSTGRPKGVMIQHGSLASYALTAARAYGVAPADRVLQFCSVSFDISIEEIVPCLTQGAELVLRTDAMLGSVATFLDTCRAWELTMLSLPTAYWHEIAAQMEAEALPLPPSLRLVIIAGERALPERLLAWRRGAPRRPRLINTYGLTESTIISTVGDLTGCVADGRREVPVGRAVADTEIYVLDPALEPVPPGVAGELYIGGGLLARGYHELPRATAERFVPHPFPPRPGERLYRTGDRARALAGGELEFLGRDDHQVKIRGYRIEIGEIEAALVRHPDLLAAAVTAPESSPGQRRLVAYAVAGARRPPAVELRSFLAETLPEYMLPAQVLFLEALPLTPNGKLDRRALPAAPRSEAAADGDAYAPPRDDGERLLAEIWRQALGVERVGIHDNFFDLGGHSLLLIRVHEAIRVRFGRELPMVELFKHPTIAALARSLGRLAAGSPPSSRVQERAARTRAAVGEERFLAARRRRRGLGMVAVSPVSEPTEAAPAPADGER